VHNVVRSANPAKRFVRDVERTATPYLFMAMDEVGLCKLNAADP
jgi:hypothetical protein